MTPMPAHDTLHLQGSDTNTYSFESYHGDAKVQACGGRFFTLPSRKEFMIWLAAADHDLVPALLVEYIILRIRKLRGRWTTDTFHGMSSSQSLVREMHTTQYNICYTHSSLECEVR
jgi:hypothetical protein